MKIHPRHLAVSSFLLLLAAGLSSCITATRPHADAKASAVLEAMSQRLASAKNLRVTATRDASPGFYAGFDVAEHARIRAVVARPGRLHAVADTNLGRRSVSYDGREIVFVDHKANTHARVKAGKDIDSAVREVENVYGVMPPLAELLVNDPASILMEGVTHSQHAGTQTIAGVLCDHLVFQQAHLNWELWVSTTDHLPRKMVITHPNGEGGPPLKVTLLIKSWDLQPPVTQADLSLPLPSGSTLVEMIPLTRP
ncbi:DUF2092 domain-containing protein [Verrucomicrobium spinosum]|uniref:DUF2092 domain-containing protein n=1 Tax=Verrucomicrobium spinosum TaxID=2736 RepID=UPI0001746822|nr:DUF2092 domain-containing protein [Verrucomicrobium spinosum]